MIIRRVLASVCVGLAVSGMAAAEESVRQPVNFDIDAQPIRLALQQFGKQAGLQVSMRLNGQAEEIAVSGVKGKLTVQEALQQMLGNSGLRYEFVNERAVRISPAHAPKSHHFDIQENPLAQALVDLSVQSGLTVVAPSALTEGKKGAQVQGDMSAEDALRHLLRGSGLTFIRWEDGTIAIQAQTASLRLGSEGVVQASDGESGLKEELTKNLMLEEIVVTAQKRTERLQDVPLSITAITSQDIERKNIVGMQDYLTFVPGVTMVDWGVGAPRIVMRGLGTSTTGEQSTVATYLGEVPLTNPLGAYSTDMKLVDMERVEVLRGPQGTLFGGGALGGAIRNIPAAPNLSSFGGKLEMGYSQTKHSNDSNGSFTGVVNIPLVEDKIGIRIAGYRFQKAGYIDLISTPDFEAAAVDTGAKVHVENDVGSQTYEGVRGTLLWKATDRLEATLMVAAQDLEENGMTDLLATLGGYRATGYLTPREEFKQDKFRLANLVVIYDLNWATLTSSVSGYKADTPNTLDQGRIISVLATTETIGNHRDSFLQEVRLTSKLNGSFQFLTGLYHEDFTSDDTARWIWKGTPEGLLAIWGTSDLALLEHEGSDSADQKALFGEASYKVADKIKFTAGGRWFDYERKTTSTNAGIFADADLDVKSQEDGAIFKAGLEYTPTTDSLIYAQWSQGFRLGRGVLEPNRALCDQDNDGREDATGLAYGSLQKSDRTENVELGTKLTLLDNHLLMNASVYRIDWTDLPITVQSPNPFCAISTNGGGAQSQGIEIESTFRPNRNWAVNLSASYTDAEFTTDDIGAKGERLPMSAKINGSVGLEYAFGLAGHDSFLRSDVSYIGDYSTGLGRPPSGDYYRLDVRAGVAFGSFDVELYGTNLNGADNVTTYLLGARGWRVAPRTVGATLRYHFD